MCDTCVNRIANELWITVYVAPERLMDKNSPLHKLLFKSGNLQKSMIGFVVTDESHCVVDW